jgi:hypothetical protein
MSVGTKVFVAFHLHRRFGNEPPSVVWHLVTINQLFYRRVSRVTNRRDHRVGRNDVTGVQNCSFSGDRGNPSVEPDFDASGVEFLLAVLP